MGWVPIFHANKEIKNAAKNNIKSVKIGNVVSEDKDTVEVEITTFFHALFNGHHDTGLKDTCEPFKAVNGHLDFFLKDLSALPDHEREDLVKDMKNEELEEIVKNCDHNKSPGLDGLSYEFYQESFSIIKEDLL